MIIVVVWKKALSTRAHSDQEHVVGAHEKRHEAEEEHR